MPPSNMLEVHYFLLFPAESFMLEPTPEFVCYIPLHFWIDLYNIIHPGSNAYVSAVVPIL
jgi:hypothetical protein